MFDYLTINNLLTLSKTILDIGIVWVLVYYCLKIVRNNSRTIQIFKGILFVILIRALAVFLGLKTVEFLADIFVNWGVLAVIIIFQPEIRSLLEKLGKTSVFSRLSTLTINEREKLVDELVKACADMSKSKTGALISLEQGHSLNDYIKTGTAMNSVVSSELLCSIFQYGTPLHDGAVIIQGVKIACAAAYFPPTTLDLPTSYGARHRAAVGISEITDSITIVISEETGNISIAEGGKLTVVNEKSLREFLLMVICQTEVEVAKDTITKESDMEKDVVQIAEEKQAEEAKNSRFSSYLKNRGKKKEKLSAKDKEEEERKKEDLEKKILEKKVEKIGIGNLMEETPELDSLFDTIVTEADAPKPRSRKEDEMKKYLKEVDPKKEKADSSSKDAAIPGSKSKEPPVRHHKPGLGIAKKLKRSKEEERPQEEPVKPVHKNMTEEQASRGVIRRTRSMDDGRKADGPLKDTMEPEAIVLNYKSSKDKASNKDHEGRKE